MTHSITDEVRYRLLRYLQDHPQASQRELAVHLGVSVGKINYCLRALIAKGLLKMRNFRNSRNKLAYTYILTRKGIEEKANVTYRFLRTRIAEYDAISAEIGRLRRELEETGVSAPDNVTG
jgi:MarR family transcriptional regulator, temperature-dependent positive regulator of motility